MRKTLSTLVFGMTIPLVLLTLFSPLARAEGLILSVDGLLPSKSDDPAAYPVLQEPKWYFGTSWTENLTETGFAEGKAVEYYQRYYEHSDMSVEFYVYRFANTNDAEAYCNRVINQTKANGGYTQVPVNNTFSVVFNYGTQETGISWGNISNVVFKVAVYTANIVEDPTDRLVSFTDMERTRILDKSGISNSVPEFPSLLVLPLFTLATLLAAKIGRRTPSKDSLILR
jgi:hypothetical protein